jgi:hypothetical protein
LLERIGLAKEAEVIGVRTIGGIVTIISQQGIAFKIGESLGAGGGQSG